jgi:pimeloyl-ACP methyl ester carboxylesterase
MFFQPGGGGGGVPPYVKHGSEEHGRYIIHCHGNGADCESNAEKLGMLAARWGVCIISWEYPGYGPRASEFPSAAQMQQDIVALYDYLRPSASSLYVYGHSMGSGPATYLASQRPVDGLILQSPYTSIAGVVANMYGWATAMLCPHVFDNATYIASVTAPILFIHGQKDTLIPWTQSQTLCALATKSQTRVFHWAVNASHNQWDMLRDVIIPVQGFLTQ